MNVHLILLVHRIPKGKTVFKWNFAGEKIRGKHGVKGRTRQVGHEVYGSLITCIPGGPNGMDGRTSVSKDKEGRGILHAAAPEGE